MTIWIVLLAGCVAFGASVVGALALPRAFSSLVGVSGLASLGGAVWAFGQVVQRYGSPEALVSALAILLGGIGAGYAVATTSLPHLAARLRHSPLPDGDPGTAQGIVLLGCAEPEHYSPRAVAARQNLLSESAEIDVPPVALPFVFFAEKARYRAVGGTSPATAPARTLAVAVAERLRSDLLDARLAWCHAPGSLAAAIASLVEAGAGRISVVPLGPSESAPLDVARGFLDRCMHGDHATEVIFAEPVWNDRLLPSRLAERILAVTVGAEAADVGVVLVDPGLPPVWERRYNAAQAVENYFDQRVRLLLGESGIAENHVRIAWLEWQSPDVTEAVRHLAALGCSRIVVAASTIALPTLDTALDLSHAIALARVPHGVQVVTVSPWGDDDAFADAICRTAAASLGIENASAR